MPQIISIILSLQLTAHALVGCCLHHAHTWMVANGQMVNDGGAAAAHEHPLPTKSCQHSHGKVQHQSAPSLLAAREEESSLLAERHTCSDHLPTGRPAGDVPADPCEDDRCIYGVVSYRALDVDQLSSECVCPSLALLVGDPATSQQYESIRHTCGTPAALPLRTHLMLSVLLR